jgi:GT2 family glycosyltransferase
LWNGQRWGLWREQVCAVHRSFLSILSTKQPKTTLIDCLGYDMFVLPGASLISREAFDSVGGFDECLVGYEDDDLFLRMFCAGYDSIYLNEPLTRWRIHHTSTSYTERMAESRMIYFRKLLSHFPDEIWCNRFYARDVIAPRFLHTVIQDYRLSLLKHDTIMMRRALGDAMDIIPHLRWQRRWMLAAIPLLKIATVGRLAMAFRRLFPVLRRLMPI